ncbi:MULTISPECIES: flagellar basal body-associated protein FliL [Oceanobacillus]|uniref:Flagellar protein FliL n=1 Tax=Oceanobacillus aidingensis TaxID=645964 RepID=A0ABV9K4I7_9BACI|nr:flagellar basal body-associated protein FliL [Oceanobacillus oncorhynchi]MDM8099267.1 flagellar basal body-associated protein FliL [Oceanobacillus oncorhynchi]UUI38601.1 flagellar basal body-associated protein FliL [Oceanobacillus oncorhynchi]
MSKIVKIAMTSIITLLVGVVATLIIVIYVNEPEETSGEQSIDEMVSHSYETPEVTTDIKDDRYVQVQFQVITDDNKAVEELEKRGFQITNLLIKELAVMEVDDFQTGLDELEDTLKTDLNEMMTEGTVTEVYTIKKILQ